jgi:hypothetical protein
MDTELKRKKLQKEVNDSLALCRTHSERGMCKVVMSKDLLRLGFILNEYEILEVTK